MLMSMRTSAMLRGDNILQIKLSEIADVPLCAAGGESFLQPTLLCNCGACQVVAGWTIFCKLEHGSRMTMSIILQYSVGFASISVNVHGTIFCKLELGSRPHRSIAIGRQKEAALAELQGRRSALGLDDLQIYLQNVVPLP